MQSREKIICSLELSSRLYSSLIAQAHSCERRDKRLTTLWIECQRLNVYKNKLRRRLENNFLLGNDNSLGVFCRKSPLLGLKAGLLVEN